MNSARQQGQRANVLGVRGALLSVLWCAAELHRLRGVYLAALAAAETEIEASFRAAIRIAKEQKSISLAKLAEASYAEYGARKKARGV